ncbi:MAG: hypothetical protein J6Y91_03025 [Alphaproteobacteria bacterium]|nr:hypothetical protein [Alphaproteobacteria bacterium]
MTYIAPDHYSYDYKLDIEKLPAQQRDRVPGKVLWPGLFFGGMFLLLGIFEVLSYFFHDDHEDYTFTLPEKFSLSDMVVQRYIFDAFVLLFGILIITLVMMAMKRCKDIFFDGENIRIEHRPLCGEPKVVTEKLHNYLGVLFRVEYYQFGLINRNRYIIELYHRDANKKVPLYISTSGKNIRKIWEYYAAKFKLPALFMSDRGLVSRSYSNLDVSLRDMAQKWKLNTISFKDLNVPSSIRFVVKSNRAILKERRLFFDAYTVLAFLGLVVLGFLALYAGLNYHIIIPYIGSRVFWVMMAFWAAVFILSAVVLFSKDVLVLSPDGILLGHNTLFMRRDIEFIPRDEVEEIDIGYNPTTERYYLSISSKERHIVYGKNMPMEDLRWIRGLVIRDVIKN